MSLLNHNFISFDGTPVTGRTPTKTIVMAESGYEMTPQLRGAVAHAYKLFCDAVNVSAFPNGYHLQNRNFPDGSKVRMESNNGVHQVMVWPVGGGGRKLPNYFGIIIDLLEVTKYPDWWDGVEAPVVNKANSVKDYPIDHDGEKAILVVIDGEAKLSASSFRDGHVLFYKVPKPSDGGDFLIGDMNSSESRKMVLHAVGAEKIFTVCGEIALPTGCGDLLFSTGLQPTDQTESVNDLTGALYFWRRFNWGSSVSGGVTTATNDYEYQLVTVVHGVASDPVVIGSGTDTRTYSSSIWGEEFTGYKLTRTENTTEIIYTNESRLYEDQPCFFFTITVPKDGSTPTATQELNRTLHAILPTPVVQTTRVYAREGSAAFVGSGTDSTGPYEDYSCSSTITLSRSETRSSPYLYEIDPWDGSFTGLGFATHTLTAHKTMSGVGTTTTINGSFSGSGPREQDNFSLTHSASMAYTGALSGYDNTAPWVFSESGHIEVLAATGAETSRDPWLLLRKTWSGSAGAVTSITTSECAIVMRHADGTEVMIAEDARALFANPIRNAYSSYSESTAYYYTIGGYSSERVATTKLNGPFGGTYYVDARGWGAASVGPFPTTTLRLRPPYDPSYYASSFTVDPVPGTMTAANYTSTFYTHPNVGYGGLTITSVQIENAVNDYNYILDGFYATPNTQTDIKRSVRDGFTPDISDLDSRIFYDRRNGAYLLQLGLTGYVGYGEDSEMYLGLLVGNKNGFTDFEPLLNDWLRKVTYSNPADQATYGGKQYARGEVAIALWGINAGLTRWQPPLY